MKRSWKYGLAAGAALLAAAAAFGAKEFPPTPETPTLPTAQAAKTRIWDFKMTAIDGDALPLSQFKGKVVMLVNTASFCGFTPQYEGLQKIHTTYAAQGFTVLAVPSGDFLDQEYKSNKEISSFCQTKFGIKFPLTEKGDVVGPNALPIYRWAATVLGEDNRPRWNFHKYLIGRDGKLIAAFGTRTPPTDPAVMSAIEAALKAKV
jgi:glutathione peroxidase